MIVRREGRGLALVCLTIVLMTMAVNAQQKILWQGAVKPEEMNVYASTSTRDRVITTLKRGDVVDVVLEINAMDDAWCRIAFPGQSEPQGYVFCFNLEQSRLAPKQIADNKPAPTQASAKSPTQKPTEATVVNSTSVASTGPTPTGALTNSDILSMTKAGLPADVLVAKIKSSVSKFDTSPAALSQLKTNGVADGVILAVVQAPTGTADSPVVQAAVIGPTTTPPSAAPALFARTSSDTECVILKRMGPADQVTSHMYSFGIRGKQFQYVEGKFPAGATFHGRLTDNDVRNVQKKGGRVVIMEPKYSADDLREAKQSCKDQ
jgi:hypothetical protein